MLEVLVFSSPRMIKKICIHPKTTPFLTFCGGISSGPGTICGTIWGSFAGPSSSNVQEFLEKLTSLFSFKPAHHLFLTKT